MDALTIALIVIAVLVIAAFAFAMIRRKQRSGTVLASPASQPRGGSGS